MRFQHESYKIGPMIHRSIGPMSSVLEPNKNVQTVKNVETSLKIAKRDFFLWDGDLKQFYSG